MTEQGGQGDSVGATISPPTPTPGLACVASLSSTVHPTVSRVTLAPVAQPAERWSCTPTVGGSMPPRGSIMMTVGSVTFHVTRTATRHQQPHTHVGMFFEKFSPDLSVFRDHPPRSYK